MNKFNIIVSLIFVLSASVVFIAGLGLLESNTGYGSLPWPLRFFVALGGGAMVGWFGTDWCDRKWPLFGGKK